MNALLDSLGVDRAVRDEAWLTGSVGLLALDRLLQPDDLHLDLDGVARAAGVTPDLLLQLRRSLGFAEVAPGERSYGDADVETFRGIVALLDSGLVETDLVLQMARVIGSSMARVATALIDVVDGAGRDALAAAEIGRADAFAEQVAELVPMLVDVMGFVWKRQLQVEAQARLARDLTSADRAAVAVGFADLVGFTALSQEITAHELADVVDRFETIAYDTVGRLGGRVVKMIGDEVMFSVVDVERAAEIALVLAETYGADDELGEVRVGLAAGPALLREGDIFGPVVNRASRIVSLAYPGSVLCDDAIHDALADVDAFTWRSIGNRKLKDIGKVPVWVLRAAPAPDDAEDDAAKRSSRRRSDRRGDDDGSRSRGHRS